MMPSSAGAHEQDLLEISAEQGVEKSTYFNAYDLATNLILLLLMFIGLIAFLYLSPTDFPPLL